MGNKRSRGAQVRYGLPGARVQDAVPDLACAQSRPSIARAWLWLSLPLLRSPAPRAGSGWLGAAPSHACTSAAIARERERVCAADEHEESPRQRPWLPFTMYCDGIYTEAGGDARFSVRIDGWRLTLLPDPVWMN